ncbi:MutH/Sau3AI family endonuclease [Oceanobacillus sp. FSL W7-1309]|uniref:MutH/Sau3AI family endonuclease n=1 Tax=Oceanobacillus sp. FSL W7-1309 TaxID=2954539 RepID=UPI0030FB67A6
MALHKFSRKELDEILSNVVGKTLGEADVNNVFARTIKHPKITGIAGDVVERSILGYPSDQDKNPDLIVDGVETELKTTGIRKPKRNNGYDFEAKEPMTITAVSPNSITEEEEYDKSSFWHKLEHLLLVYYHYDSSETVSAAEYANFFIKGYHFHQFSDEDKEILKNDWLIVRDFIQFLKDTYEKPQDEYPRISSDLKKKLMLIDTSPKWPNRPRFRLKRTTVSTIVQKHFGAKFEKLDETYSSFKELDDELHHLTKQYNNKTVRELMNILDIPIKVNKKGNVSKSVTEQIIVKMFGGKAKKLSKIELFSKIGIIPKTIVQTDKGLRTEDMKLFQIDFKEWTNQDTHFDESFVYSYFNGQQFLCIVFEEPSTDAKLLDNKFIGFKRLAIDESVLENDIKNVWGKIRDLINNNKLIDEPVLDKNGNHRITPKTKIPMTAPNFPKSQEYNFFVRGSGEDASKKTLVLNGIRMYPQYFWIKGGVVISMLKDIDFI